MQSIWNLLVHHVLFGLTMFAAGAPPLTGALDTAATDAGSDAGADLGADLDTGDGLDAVDDAAATEEVTEPEAVPETKPAEVENKEEPEAQEFTASVSSRIRNFVKRSPQLAAAFKADPKLQSEFEATFRREAAYREAFPTIAEARTFRENFPNGMADIQQLQADVTEAQQLDNDFYTRDPQGNYPGHAKLLQGMAADDPQATKALMRTALREWSRFDPESYNERMGAVLSATLANDGVPEYIGEMLEVAKASKQDQLAGGLEKLLGWMQKFSRPKSAPSDEEKKLQTERQQFDQQRQQHERQEGQKFHTSFVSQSKKLQGDVIAAHPAIKRLEKVPGISADKRAKIVEEIRGKIEKLLSNSPSFMRKLKPAYESRNIEETIKLQRAAWSQPWLLNKMVREVLRVETPAMVRQNRETGRRAGAPGQRPNPARPGVERQQQQRKGPRQMGGRWYREDGTAYTTSEVLSGKHLTGQ